ncbi:hypothetical protein JCM30760_00230 [Thiomicrorhabdus hydrogeniphila]
MLFQFLLSKQNKLTFFFIAIVSISFSNKTMASAGNFEKAVNLYNNHNYESAYKLFLVLVEQDYSSVDYSFYLAQTAAKLHKDQEAITAYERILILQPNNTRAKLELGKIYYDQAEFTLAKTYFDDAKNDEVPDTVRKNINLFLDQIENKTQKSKLSGSIILGVGHDNNINVSPEASSWFVPVFGQNFNSASDPVANLYTEQAALVTHIYNARSKYGFDIKNNLLFYNKSIPGESEYNILFLRYQPSLIFTKENYTVETALQYDTMRYGGDAYLETYGFVPKISHVIDSTSLVSAHLKLLFKNYLRSSDQQRDASYNELGFKYFKKITTNTTWLNSVDLAQERQDKKTTLDVSNNSWSVKTGFYHLFSSSIQLGTELQYSQKNHIDKNLFFLNKREDSTLTGSIFLSKNINKDIAVQLRVEHINNNSNQEAYTYNKNVFLVNLINRF